MTSPPSPTPPEFEPFLHAEICREDNGMVLTVASAFARLDLDPWRQAATLARLPDATAAASLAALIGRLHAGSRDNVRAEAAAIASRLVPLLPKATARPLPGEDGGAALSAAPRGINALWLFWGAVAVVAVYMVWF